MEAVTKTPNYPVAQNQPMLAEERGKLDIKRKYLVAYDIVANLPAKASSDSKTRNDQVDNSALPVEVGIKGGWRLVFLPDVVRRRRYDEVKQA
jgi:hypothetical protein